MSDLNEQILAELKAMNKKLDQLVFRMGQPGPAGAAASTNMFPVNHVGPGAMPGMTGDPGAMAAMAGASRPDGIKEEIQRRIDEARRQADMERAKAESMVKSMAANPIPVMND